MIMLSVSISDDYIMHMQQLLRIFILFAIILNFYAYCATYGRILSFIKSIKSKPHKSHQLHASKSVMLTDSHASNCCIRKECSHLLYQHEHILWNACTQVHLTEKKRINRKNWIVSTIELHG